MGERGKGVGGGVGTNALQDTAEKWQVGKRGAQSCPRMVGLYCSWLVQLAVMLTDMEAVQPGRGKRQKIPG